jgi:alpha-beta hydrolase superfamily lysophospholipase
VTDRFTRLPAYLAERSRIVRLGRAGIPALLAHPDWLSPTPTVLWLHGRTAHKELDPGRYLRWIRAGIAACAVDLPGHGQRADPDMQTPERTLDVLEQVIPEIDVVVESLADPWEPPPALDLHPSTQPREPLFDLDRLAIGGVSAGGMAALRRLCDPDHPFRCAAVESTTGDLSFLYHPDPSRPWPRTHPPHRVAKLDPMLHLNRWKPIPVLALHSESDRVVPIAGVRRFLDALRGAYGSSRELVRLVTWPSTGAPEEHAGFGRVSNEAKNLQTAFLRSVLLR